MLGEQHVHYIIELLQTMIEEDLASVEVKEDACRAYNDKAQEDLQWTARVRKGEAHGYYRHDESGRVVLATPRHNSQVWHDTREPKLEHIHLTKRTDGRKLQDRPLLPLGI